MAGPTASSSPRFIRSVPLVLVLFLMSSLPLLPATEATSSRNIQDFMITDGIEPLLVKHITAFGIQFS